eukprot:1195765-Prorocentrum_minimum.AAC.10
MLEHAYLFVFSNPSPAPGRCPRRRTAACGGRKEPSKRKESSKQSNSPVVERLREEKGAPAGVVNRAGGPALGSWEVRPPAAYEWLDKGLTSLGDATHGRCSSRRTGACGRRTCAVARTWCARACWWSPPHWRGAWRAVWRRGEQREKVGNWAQGEKRGRGAMGVESTLAVIGTGGPAAALAGQWFGAFIVPETPHDDWLVEGLASHLTGRAPHRQSYKVTKLHTTKPGHMRLLWRQSYKATRLQSPS